MQYSVNANRENAREQKKALLIHATNYPKDAEQLRFDEKIKRMEKLTSLNQQTKINSVHISLNFDPSEKLSDEKLKEITGVYMAKIGFNEQPYLVYQHNDAGHPHLHIVTTNIKADGKRIELHNLARNQSMKAAKEIEKEYGLVIASQKNRLRYQLKPVNVQKALYGKSETKRAITNILDHVLPNYKYTSLAELNAVLRLYNVVADRGSEDSRIYKGKGLLYRILDEKGNKVGSPVKASVIYNKPLLSSIENRFEANNIARQKHKQRVKNAVDLAFVNHPGQPLPELIKRLQKEQVQIVLRQNEKGVIYGMTYVDYQTKCVFNGSDLGKQYSANAMQLRCSSQEPVQQQIRILQEQSHSKDLLDTLNGIGEIFPGVTGKEYNPLPNELKQNKRKRKRIHH